MQENIACLEWFGIIAYLQIKRVVDLIQDVGVQLLEYVLHVLLLEDSVLVLLLEDRVLVFGVLCVNVNLGQRRNVLEKHVILSELS